MAGWNKTDMLFKALANKRTTDQNKSVYEEKGDLVFNTHAQDVWLDAIPGTPPGSTTSIVHVYVPALTLIVDQSAGNSQTWFASTYGIGWSGLTSGQKTTATTNAQDDNAARIKNWIAERYGSGYAVLLYDKNGVLVPSGDGSNWFFNCMTGILTFANGTLDDGSTIASRGPYAIAGYVYVGRIGVNDGITEVDSGAGLTGGPITTIGTLSVDLTYGFNWTNTHSFSQSINLTNTGGSGGAQLVFTSGSTPSSLSNGMMWYESGGLMFRSGSTTFNLLNTMAIGNTVSGGTPGSVLFVDGSSDLGQDNTKFFWDDTNHRLGIGLNSPSGALHLSSSTLLSGGIWFGADCQLYRTGSNNMTFSSGLGVGSGFSVDYASGTTSINYVSASTPGSTLILRSRSADDGSGSVRILDVRHSDNSIIAQITADGTLKAVKKSFRIPHPLRPGQWLEHGSLEGPEHGVYQRGRANGIGSVTVVLKDYWEKLSYEDYTIQITSHGDYSLFIADQNANRFTVSRCGGESARSLPLEFSWLIIGGRKDAPLIVEP